MEQLSSRLPISAGSMDARTERLGLIARRSLVCLEKIGPVLKGVRLGERIGEFYGTSAFYAGADHREAA